MRKGRKRINAEEIYGLTGDSFVGLNIVKELFEGGVVLRLQVVYGIAGHILLDVVRVICTDVGCEVSAMVRNGFGTVGIKNKVHNLVLVSVRWSTSRPELAFEEFPRTSRDVSTNRCFSAALSYTGCPREKGCCSTKSKRKDATSAIPERPVKCSHQAVTKSDNLPDHEWEDDGTEPRSGKNRIATNSDIDHLLIVYRNQNEDEKHNRMTRRLNGVGFNKMDAPVLTELAEKYLDNGNLTKDELETVHRLIAKYRRQWA